MPGFERDQQAIDNTIENRRLGSAMSITGWTLLLFDAIPLTYVFISLQDGSIMWPAWAAIEGVVGLGLVVAGMLLQRKIGRSRLGQLSQASIAREQRRDEQEQRRVA